MKGLYLITRLYALLDGRNLTLAQMRKMESFFLERRGPQAEAVLFDLFLQVFDGIGMNLLDEFIGLGQ